MARVLAANHHSLTRAFSFPHSWKFTLGVLFIAQILSAVGFSMIFPFLPLYIESLGSAGGHSTEMLAGLVISVQGITMMIAAPFWGAVADRFGRKKMIMRALFGGAITLTLMGFVQSAEQLILVRAMQGVVTGTVSANNALVAAATPRHRVGFAMGTLQVGLWAGVAVGPLLGGVLADLFGYSIPFVVTAVLLLAGGMVVMLGVNEDFSASQRREDFHAACDLPRLEINRADFRRGHGAVLRFLSSLARVIIVPIAPLFVVSLIARETDSSNTYAGLVMAVSAATSTFGAVTWATWATASAIAKCCSTARSRRRRFTCRKPLSAMSGSCCFLQGLAGFAAGGLVAAPSALLSRYTDKDTAGAVYGIDNSVVAGSKAVAPIFGASVAIVLGMRGTFVAAALVFALNRPGRLASAAAGFAAA